MLAAGAFWTNISPEFPNLKAKITNFTASSRVIINLVILGFVIVIGLLLTAVFLGANDPKRIPESWQNFMEATVEFTQDIARNQLGESSYRTWLPFVSTMFLFIFGCNWSGALVPWKLLVLPEGELAAPTNDINTTVALSLLT